MVAPGEVKLARHANDLDDDGHDTFAASANTFINVVSDYGATGDGVTDDTAAVQAAIDAWKTTGATIYFPRGTYEITAQLDVDSTSSTGHILFLGEGGQDNQPASIINMETANTTAFKGNADAYVMAFDSLWIQGPGGGSSGAGIWGNTRNIETRHCRISGFFYGIRMGNTSYYSRLTDTLLYSNASHGIWQESGSNNLIVTGCRITTNGGCGIKIDGSQGTKIIGGAIENNTSHGISVDTVGGQTTDATYIAGVYFENNGSAGVKVGDTASVRSTTITGCMFTAPQTGYFIDVEAADYVTIGANHFLGGGGSPSSGDIRLQSGITHAVQYNNRPSGVGNTYTSTPIILENAVDLSAIDFLVGTASGLLSGEIAVGTTPGGELGGTWASPTVDATHSGSAHIALSASVPLVESGSGSAGSGTAASKDDHVHPLSAGGGVGPILITDTPAGSPLIFADLLQTDEGDDLLYADA